MTEKIIKLVNDFRSDKELSEKISDMSEPEKILAFLNERGYDVTMDDLLSAEKELSSELAEKNDENALSVTELEKVAGGVTEFNGENDTAKDGHEIGCNLSYHGRGWCEENNEWCGIKYYFKCKANRT